MNDFSLLLPEFLLTGLAFIVLGVDLFLVERDKRYLPWVSSTGIVTILLITMVLAENGQLYDGTLIFDDYTKVFRVFFLVSGLIVVLMSRDYVKTHLKYQGEYYAILVFTIVAAMLLASSAELLTAYISLELLSFGLYVLVAYDRYNPKSNEGSLKYILLGAFSSALILFGISQIYGLTGSTRFDEISYVLSNTLELPAGLMVGLVLVMAGLGFKLAAVPFHMWAPDAYEGAPLPVTAWLAVGSKAASIALVMRFFAQALMPSISEWQYIVIVMSVLTMLVGNLSALVQKNIKRLLAYSSVGHVGYILMGIAALGSIGDDGSMQTLLSHLVSNGLMFHVVAYGITTLAAFLCLTVVHKHNCEEDISSLAGLSKTQPLVSLVLVSSLFSLAGLPVFIGFTSKFYLFNAVGAQGLLWVVAIAIIASLISLYYYLMVARQLYIEEPKLGASVPVSLFTKVLLVSVLILIVVGGVYPSPLMEVIQSATDAVISGSLVKSA